MKKIKWFIGIVIVLLIGIKMYNVIDTYIIHRNDTCIITFMSCNDANMPENQMIKYNQKVSKPPYPILEGYSFKGWYKDNEYKDIFDFDQKIKEDTTIYAKFEVTTDDWLSKEEYKEFQETINHIQDISSQFSDENGYISKKDVSQVIDKVSEFVMKNDSVEYYEIGNDYVYFETQSLIPVVYQPPLEGVDSGTGETNILTIDPFTDEEVYKSKLRGSFAYDQGKVIQTSLANKDIDSYKSSAVDIDSLEELPDCEYLLWHGHGGYTNVTHSYLVTSQLQSSYDELFYMFNEKNKKYLYVTTDTGYLAVTSNFFKKEEMVIDDGLVYLATCKSGLDDILGNTFIELGADVVFVNRGNENIATKQDQFMMESIIDYMSAKKDGIYHNAKSALEQANREFENYVVNEYGFESLDDYNDFSGDVTVGYIGAGDFTLCSGIRGKIISNDIDISKISIQLDEKEKVQVESEFYLNDITPGIHDIKIYYDDKLMKEVNKIIVEEHRYTDIQITLTLFDLNCVVKDEDGNYLENVDIRIEGYESEYLGNGKYCVKDIVEGDYELIVSASHYNFYKTTITINHNKEIEVILKKANIDDDAVMFNSHYYKVFVDENFDWNNAKLYCEQLGGHLATITSASEDQFCYGLIMSLGYNSAYFGYSDQNCEGHWSWVTGEFSEYSNFALGEPNNENNNENYGMYYSKYNGKWNDGDGSVKSGTLGDSIVYICEWD